MTRQGRLRIRTLLAPALLALAGCGGGEPAAHGEDAAVCTTGMIGDANAAPEVEILLRNADGSSRLGEEMAEADLILPPQGGKVLLAAPRLRNMDVCSVRVTATLRDECSGRIIGVEVRPLRFVAAADGWAEPQNPHQMSSWSNLPVCPSAAAERDLEGEPYLLTLEVEDARGVTASATIRVVPTCAEPEFLDTCLCECDGQYRLGQSCAADEPLTPWMGCAP